MKNVEATAADQTATVADQGADVEPEKTSSKKRAPKATKGAKPAAPKKGAKTPRRAGAQNGASEERSNKKAEVIALMKRAKGVTLPRS
jgi:hypothetical protein